MPLKHMLKLRIETPGKPKKRKTGIPWKDKSRQGTRVRMAEMVRMAMCLERRFPRKEPGFYAGIIGMVAHELKISQREIDCLRLAYLRYSPPEIMERLKVDRETITSAFLKIPCLTEKIIETYGKEPGR